MNSLTAKVIKDYDIPIQAISNKHMEYALTEFKEFDKYKDAFFFAKKYIETEGLNPEQFDAKTHEVSDRCIQAVMNLDSYKYFSMKNLPVLDKETTPFPQYSNGLDIYKNQNNGKRFISIDLTHANIQSLKFADALFEPKFADQVDNFAEFLEHFGTCTNYYLKQYMSNSKRMRQIIFGNLNPKRQQHMERYMVESLIKELIDWKVLKLEDFYGYTTDEIILNETPNTIVLAYNKFDSIYNIATSGEIVDDDNISKELTVHIEDFTLEKLEPYDFWVKKDHYGDILSIKKVPIVYYLQVLKHLNNKPVVEEDMMFLYEKLPCKFITKLWDD